MNKLIAAIGLAFLLVTSAWSVTLERIISREDPKFDCTAAVLTVGRDGNVYLASNIQPGYVLRVSRDGTSKLGGDVVGMLANATANATGVIATANMHFGHTVKLFDPNFKLLAACDEFLVNDTVQWDAPARVEVGASGDFYGIDQHRLRILRINPAGKVVQVYTFPAEAKAWDFRVCEATQSFYLPARDGTMRCVGFDGKVRWAQKLPGIFTSDDAGTVYVLSGGALKHFSPTGEALGEIKLPVTSVTAIAVFGNELIIKRADPTELFQVNDLTTGQQKRIVHSDHERVTAEFPGLVWTAGEQVAMRIQSSSAAVQWHVWATAYGDTDWRELVWHDNQLQVPADWAGLYQLRLAPTLNPTGQSEYNLHAIIEVRAPDSRGTVSVWTPLNRIWWGRGEAIPVSVATRTTNAVPDRLKLELLTAQRSVWSTNCSPAATVTIPAAFTAQLADGRYELRATAPGFTCVAQPIRIGPGLAARSPFRTTQHGDYGGFASHADAWEFADVADALQQRARTLGVNQFVNRVFVGGYPLAFMNNADGLGMLSDLTARLATDPTGVATQKVGFGFAQVPTLGAFGAYGIRELLLLAAMDSALPLGTPLPYLGPQTPAQYAAEIKSYGQLTNFPAFYGWDWAANWWVANYDLRYTEFDPKKDFESALKTANETGTWDPVLDSIGEAAINWQVDAQNVFRKAFHEVTTNRTTASSGPYRRPEVYPPVSFANVDEVDLHFQAEQISCPVWPAHAPDFYKRPGKPAWIHPEVWNDNGTGEQILPASWLAIMRGVDGIGCSGQIPNWGVQPTDSRSGYPGVPSVFRALNEFARRYGPWLTTLQNSDRIGIVVSYRQIKLDTWGGIGGQYFTRLWEAYTDCLYARQPATFIYPEDKPDLRRFKALLVVGQRYEIDPSLVELLAQAKKQGIAILADSTCRESLVKDFTPLGVAFDKIEKLNGFNNDVAFWDFPEALLATAPVVAAKLAALAPPVAVVDQPEVLVSERHADDARFVWVVNYTHSPLDPGLLWRVNNAIATCPPVVANVKLSVKKGEVVYDVFSGKTVGAEFAADLRFSQARLYAVLPRAIKSLDLQVPKKLKPGQTFQWTATVPGIKAKLPLYVALRDATGALIEERHTTTGSGTLSVPMNVTSPVSLEARELVSGKSTKAKSESLPPDALFGPRLRDITVSTDGKTALVNAFEWGQNLYALDLANGKVRWTGNVGDYFAYAPVAIGDGFGVQGNDLHSGEEYHLYRVDTAGKVTRRFALPGLPSRLPNWAFAPMLNDRLNNFTVAPDGAWIAAAGNLGLATWSVDGQLWWSQDWSQSKRETMKLVAADRETLVTGLGMKLAAFEARTGKARWELTLAPAGEIQGLAASGDGQTIAARTTAQSGRVFVVRAGKVIGSLPTAADAVVLSPDGSNVAVTTGQQLKWYAADGRLQWVFRGNDTLRFPRLSPDGKHIAVSSELGTVYLVDVAHGTATGTDMGAIAAPAWLPAGDLVLATWQGTVCRLGVNGAEKWRVNLNGVPRPVATAGTQSVATTHATFWSNAEATPLPLTSNLIVSNAVIVRGVVDNRALELQNSPNLLFDGQTNAPAKPWMKWESIAAINGWGGGFSLEIDTFRTQLRVTAITFVEDAAHPESWLRDARLEYWDVANDKWVFVQYLTSDAPVHTHKLIKPVEAAKFRLAPADGSGWPASNLRFAEIIFHGEKLGGSHPDAIQNKPVAMLFDERESDVAVLGPVFHHGGAFSGASFIEAPANKFLCPAWEAAMGGSVMPNWDFEIVENPTQVGQYRWVEFAYKALSPSTRGVVFRIGYGFPGGAVVVDFGEPYKVAEGIFVRKQLADKPATEWTVVKLDLWQILHDGMKDKPSWKGEFRIHSINLGAVDGPAGLDRVRLGRTEADFAAAPANGKP